MEIGSAARGVFCSGERPYEINARAINSRTCLRGMQAHTTQGRWRDAPRRNPRRHRRENRPQLPRKLA